MAPAIPPAQSCAKHGVGQTHSTIKDNDIRRQMIRLTLENDTARRASFYLAMERWAATCLPPGEDYIYTWVIAPTVVIGRHQDLDSEVNVARCRQLGIDICRRHSGGGAIYADTHNIMLSYIADAKHASVPEAFARYTDDVCARLRTLGIDAVGSGRNDVCVDGRKVSGGAFYDLGERYVAHSTMLWDTDTDTMRQVLTPPAEKLQRHGVASVASRVAGLRTIYPGLGFDTLRAALDAPGADGTVRVVTNAEIAEIERLQRTLYTDEWTYRKPR